MSIRSSAHGHRYRGTRISASPRGGQIVWANFVLLFIFLIPVVISTGNVEASAESDPQDETKSTTWLSSISVFGRPPRRRRKSELPGNDQINSAFIDQYRCPEEFATFTQKLPLSDDRGFFRFGSSLESHAIPWVRHVAVKFAGV